MVRFPRFVRSRSPRRIARFLPLPLLSLSALTAGIGWAATYTPPPASADLVKKIPFNKAHDAGAAFKKKFDNCDLGPCKTDKNQNKALLKFPDGTLFFEAKMALDTDGATFQGSNGDQDHKPETAWTPKLPLSDTTPKKVQRSVDSNAIRYIVLPLGTFRQEMNVKLGDVAMVISDGKMSPAVVADLGPFGPEKFRLGEGSISLHEALGHSVRILNPDGSLKNVKDVSVPKGVLYFVFPDSMPSGLTWENMREKVRA